MKLLEDILVLDFSQFLSGPSASLRLADMGAQVIKIERPGLGDICRQLYVSDIVIEGESTIFHAINRNKQSYVADLKNEAHFKKVIQLIAKADIMIHNFRPGVMERLGLGHESIKAVNPQIVYAEISGYGTEGPWKGLPGQDLLIQSVSGLLWLSNNHNEGPVPMGVAVADILAGTHLTQGILAALYECISTGVGSKVEVNMLESMLDFQFEILTCFFNDGKELPQRGNVNNAHAYIAAPYGIYKTTDGFIAIAMAHIPELADLLLCPALNNYANEETWFSNRDEIKGILSAHLVMQSTDHWLSILQPADTWCSEVLDYDALVKEKGYELLNMGIEVETSNGLKIKTTRCPLRVDGHFLLSKKGAPLLGEDNEEIEKQFNLKN